MDRRDVDDSPALSLLDHLLGCGLRAKKRPGEIHSHNFLPRVEWIIHESNFLLDSRVVDKDVQLSENGDCFLNEIIDVARK